MNPPTVSIGLSVKNPGSSFRLALQSIFAQTYTDWELLIADDMSTDGAYELASSLDDPRVRVMRDGREMSLNIRLNELVQLARGKYFVRMDADDVMHPERIARQVQALEESGPDTVVGSSCYQINMESVVVGFKAGEARQQSGFAARRSFIHPTVAAFTEWFRRNPYSERFPYARAEDVELWCRSTENSRFLVLPDPLLFYREGSSSFLAYIGCEMALLHILIERFQKPRVRYLKFALREVMKLGIAFTLHSAGRWDLYVNRRISPIDLAMKREASELLARIRCIALPVREPVHDAAG